MGKLEAARGEGGGVKDRSNRELLGGYCSNSVRVTVVQTRIADVELVRRRYILKTEAIRLAD